MSARPRLSNPSQLIILDWIEVISPQPKTADTLGPQGTSGSVVLAVEARLVAASDTTQQSVGGGKRIAHLHPSLRDAVVEHHVDRSRQVRTLATGNGHYVRAALEYRPVE